MRDDCIAYGLLCCLEEFSTEQNRYIYRQKEIFCRLLLRTDVLQRLELPDLGLDKEVASRGGIARGKTLVPAL